MRWGGPHWYVNELEFPDGTRHLTLGARTRETADALASWCGYKRVGLWRVYLKAPQAVPAHIAEWLGP